MTSRPVKLLLLSILLRVASTAADNASLSGQWHIQASVADHESAYSCTFAQEKGELTGSCNPPQGAVKITGKVEGMNVTWTYKSEYNGSPLTVVFKGTVDSANKITGVVSAEEYGVEGPFTATPSK